MKEKLREAIKTGETLHIRYFGGRTPGSERYISPINIYKDKVRAHCMQTESVKTFMIYKLELVIPGEPSQLAFKHSFEPPEFTNIEEIANYLTDSLQAFVWITQTTETSITLHGAFKNGKAKKTPVVSLDFEEFKYMWPEPDTSSPDFDWDDFVPDIVEGYTLEDAEMIKRKRPWVVRAKSKETATYGLSKKAIIRFMEWADELSPSE